MSAYSQTLIDAAFTAYQAGHPAEAATALGFALGTGRDGLITWFLGHLALQAGDPAAALPWLAVGVALDPAHAKAHRDLAETQRRLGRLDEAVDAYQRAVAIDPALVEAYGGLVTVLHLLNRDVEALARAQQAVRSAGDTASAHRILGTVLGWHNRHAEAAEQYQAAQALRPDDATACYHQGLSLLALGQYREGWQRHDARRRIDLAESGRRAVPGPVWRGEDIAGQTILLHTEQGFGDAIQFVRYAPLVAARGARVWLEADPALLALFASIPGIALFASIPGIAGVLSPTEERPAFAVHCPLMSLPLAFGTELGSIPAQGPYLHADPERVAAWRARIGTEKRLQVGLAWAGNPAHPYDRLRSIPLDRLAPLLTRPDCVFHTLQTGPLPTRAPQTEPPQTETAAPEPDQLAASGLRDHRSALTDFAEAAALATALDLVIAVDSAPAHLSGALARPTWLLLPHSADWRWMADRTDSPWYPTMRLFRQPAPGDWDAVVAAVGDALDELAARPR